MATIDDQRVQDPAVTAKMPTPGYTSADRKGVWYFNNAIFPMEDPTNVGSGKPLTRFIEKHFTQATETAWSENQWRAGVFKKFDGDPADEGTKEVVFVPATASATATAVAAAASDGTAEAAARQKEVEGKLAEAEKAEADRLAAEETAKKAAGQQGGKK